MQSNLASTNWRQQHKTKGWGLAKATIVNQGDRCKCKCPAEARKKEQEEYSRQPIISRLLNFFDTDNCRSLSGWVDRLLRGHRFVLDLLVEAMDKPSLDDVYNQLSPTKYFCALFIMVISCSLSFCGSMTIAYLILRKRLWQRDFFQRTMLGLCVADLVSTSGTFIQPMLLPRFTKLPLAIGNVGSCEAGAFLSLFVWSSYLYSAEISIYFLLTIRYNWKEERIKDVLEPWVHIFPWVVPFLLGSISVALDSFNPSSVLGLCTFASFPVDCRTTGECERGGYDILRFVLWPASAIACAAAFCGIGCTWLVFSHVRNQSRRNNRFDFEFSAGSNSDAAHLREKKIRAVAWQALFYAVGFMNAFLVPLLSTIAVFYITASKERIFHQNDTAFPFLTMLATYMFFPVQGFVNWIVYTRPILFRWKDCHPDRSWLWCYRQLLACRPTPWTSRTAHLTHTTNEHHTPQGQERRNSYVDSVGHRPESMTTPSTTEVQNGFSHHVHGKSDEIFA